GPQRLQQIYQTVRRMVSLPELAQLCKKGAVPHGRRYQRARAQDPQIGGLQEALIHCQVGQPGDVASKLVGAEVRPGDRGDLFDRIESQLRKAVFMQPVWALL